MNSARFRLPPIAFTAALVIGLFAAFYLGRVAGQGNYVRIATVVVAAVGIVTCLTLKTKIWLIIPFCWTLTGQISVLPIPFNVREIAALTVLALFLMFYALKLVPKAHPTGWIDVLVILNLAYLASVFLRNPVGVSAFGSTMVGGRPYFAVFIGGVAFWIFSRVRITEKVARQLPLLLFIGPMVVSILGMFTYFFPATVPIIAPFYNGINVGAYMETQQATTGIAGPSGSGRLSELGPVGLTGILILCAYYRPISLFLALNIGRFLFFTVSLLAVLLSGFRSMFVAAGAYLAMASYFRIGGKDVVRILAFGLAMLSIVVLSNGNLFKLPTSIQRTLSFLPGNWDEIAAREAKGSSEWRFEMWREVWGSEKWIKNKVLGDGFGFSDYELKIMKEASWGGSGFIGGGVTESQKIQGAYHSGPLSAIRYVGIVGLVFYTALLVYLAFWAAAFIRTTKGTTFFPAALFLGLPLVFEPFNYMFMFGGFDSGLPTTLFFAGLLKMLSVSFQGWQTGRLAESENLVVSAGAPKSVLAKQRFAPSASPLRKGK